MTTTTELESKKTVYGWHATPIDAVAVGMGATVIGHTDREPYEVIAKTAKTVTVRSMSATIDPTWKPEIAEGGFSGHCSNQGSQRWTMESDPTGHVEVLRLTKSGWHGRSGRYGIGVAVKFHDYNF